MHPSLLILGALATLGGQQVSPPGLSKELAQPFSFYLVPSDELGFQDCPAAFQLTYDGALNNGFGEMDFQAGTPLTPVDQRIKTTIGHFPFVTYGFKRNGVSYRLDFICSPKDLDPSEDLIAFVSVHIKNLNKTTASADFRASFGPRHGEARAEMPCRPWYRSKFMSASEWGSGAGGAMENGAAVSDGHLAYLYSGSPQTNQDGLAVDYNFQLAPQEEKEIGLKVPFVPIAVAKSDQIVALEAMDPGIYRARLEKYWNSILDRALNLSLDDPKVVATMRSSLFYDLIARDIEADGKHFTQTVNKFQYHDFYMRDTSFIARSYEMMNLPDIARTTVEKYLVRDGDGKVVRFLREMPDDWGQSLWAVGSYYRATGDREFAREVLPAIGPHLDEFVAATSKDPLGLWPVAEPYDNELINGHYTSHDLWAILGLAEAKNLCLAAGDSHEAARADMLYKAFKSHFLSRLSTLVAGSQGYIPPGMDSVEAGNDWENATGGVYPFHVLPPNDPWVTATIGLEREYKYREGIMTYGPNAWVAKEAAAHGKDFDAQNLHDYETFQVDETLLARDEQQKVVEDLYSVLVHTSSTNAGFETSIRPWGDRNPGGNYPPHGWFAARYNELLRNMFLREDGDVLHLASALAPRWIEPGKTVAVRNGLTDFGLVSYRIASQSEGAKVQIEAHWRVKPKSLLFHIPWFVRAESAYADGRRTPIIGNAVSFSPSTRSLVLKWTWRKVPDLSYERAVRLWLHKAYEPAPGEDMDHLFPTLTRPRLANPDTLFVGSYSLALVPSTDKGKIHFTLDGTEPTSHSAIFSQPISLTRTTTVRAIEIVSPSVKSEPMEAQIVKAFFRPAAAHGELSPGVAYSYFEGNFEGMPDFRTLSASRRGVAPTPDLEAVSHRSERFALDFKGFVNAPSKGVYKFTLGSDDGSKLWIDGDLVVNNDGPHAYAEATGRIPLDQGPHTFRIEYFDSGGANSLHFFWTTPKSVKERVPASALGH